MDERCGIPADVVPPPGFEEFYRATVRRLLDTTLRLAGGDVHVATDATQQAYVEMLRHWSLRSHQSVDANRRYATKIAANKIADHFRRWREVPFVDIGAIEVRSDQLRACAALAEQALEAVHVKVDGHLPEYAVLLKIVDELPARRRAAATLYFLEELDCEEIAGILEIKTTTVRTHIQRARERLLPYARKLRDALEGGAS